MAEKLLYFYPPLTPTAAQLDHMQFCEALLAFSRYVHGATIDATQWCTPVPSCLPRACHVFIVPRTAWLCWCVLGRRSWVWSQHIHGRANDMCAPGPRAPRVPAARARSLAGAGAYSWCPVHDAMIDAWLRLTHSPRAMAVYTTDAHQPEAARHPVWTQPSHRCSG